MKERPNMVSGFNASFQVLQEKIWNNLDTLKAASQNVQLK
jgi:hypothetical protein